MFNKGSYNITYDFLRVSKVFDRLCVSSRSWEASREEMIARRDEEAIRNPTPAMKVNNNQEFDHLSQWQKAVLI